jgi:hypothetical protein
MTPDEAKALLPQFAEGLVKGSPALELEVLLARSPDLQDELRRIKEENALLEEALAPLRPSQSARIRLTDRMYEVHRRAEVMAQSLPVKGWRIFRLLFTIAALSGALALFAYRPPSAQVLAEKSIFLYTIMGLFTLGLLFVLGGRFLARAEARLKAGLTRDTFAPGTLEVLMVQVFGVLAVLVAVGMYFWL